MSYTVTAANGSTVACTVKVTRALLTMLPVPAGTFQRDITPTNTSYVSAFRMSEEEITRAQFAAVLGSDPSDNVSSSGTGDPVQVVNWYHAIAFCNKMSVSEGLTPVYDVSGVNFATLPYSDIPTPNQPDATWNATTAIWTNNVYEWTWDWFASYPP